MLNQRVKYPLMAHFMAHSRDDNLALPRRHCLGCNEFATLPRRPASSICIEPSKNLVYFLKAR